MCLLYVTYIPMDVIGRLCKVFFTEPHERDTWCRERLGEGWRSSTQRTELLHPAATPVENLLEIVGLFYFYFYHDVE